MTLGFEINVVMYFTKDKHYNVLIFKINNFLSLPVSSAWPLEPLGPWTDEHSCHEFEEFISQNGSTPHNSLGSVGQKHY